MRHIHVTIRAALGQAKRWKRVTTNVAEDARPTPIPQKRLTTPTPDQVRELATAIESDDPELAIVVLLAALTGCRRGELCGLRWTDVDWDTSVLEVRRAFVVAAGKVTEKAPKSGRERSVVLDELAIERLGAITGLCASRLGLFADSAEAELSSQHRLICRVRNSVILTPGVGRGAFPVGR